MTALPDFDAFEGGFGETANEPPVASYSVEETFWGYIVRSNLPESLWVTLGQGLSGVVAMSFLVASIGMWLMPGAMFAGSVVGMKALASLVLLTIAFLLARYADTGQQFELQVDTRLGEVREVAQTRTGNSKVVATYGFDAVQSLIIVPSRIGSGIGQLMMKRIDDRAPVTIAVGMVSSLERLQSRVERDLILQGRSISQNDDLEAFRL